MINALTEKEIFDYLMTSDFEEGLTPDEFKLLLFKLRNYYRIMYGRNETLNSEIKGKNSDYDSLKYQTSKMINDLKEEKNRAEAILEEVYNRKLTFLERWSGKIKNVNEIK